MTKRPSLSAALVATLVLAACGPSTTRVGDWCIHSPNLDDPSVLTFKDKRLPKWIEQTGTLLITPLGLLIYGDEQWVIVCDPAKYRNPASFVRPPAPIPVLLTKLDESEDCYTIEPEATVPSSWICVARQMGSEIVGYWISPLRLHDLPWAPR